MVRVADVENIGSGALAGLMIRDGLASGSSSVFVAITPAGDVVFNNQAVLTGFSAPCWIVSPISILEMKT